MLLVMDNSQQLDWENYKKVFQEFMATTDMVNHHETQEVDNTSWLVYSKAKNMLQLVGLVR